MHGGGEAGEDAPASARALAEVLGQVFPPDYITVAEGGREEAEALVDKPFDVIFFTGSPAVGKKVMAAAAEHLTPSPWSWGAGRR